MTQLFIFQLGFWIIFFIMLAFVLFFAIKWFMLKMFYFSNMDMSQIIIKRVKIPVGDIKLNAKIVLPKYALDENSRPRPEYGKLPLIIVNHGWGMNIDLIMLMQYVAAIALGGPYVVLAFDVRGFGKSPGKAVVSPKLFADVPKVIDFGEQLEEVDPTRMAYAGMSLGGQMTLMGAYPDKRIKALVAIVAPHNVKENFTRGKRSIKEQLYLGFLRILGVNGKKISVEVNEITSPEFILQKETDLQVKAGMRLLLLNAPADTETLLGALPEGVNVTRTGTDGFDAVLLFAKNSVELNAGWPAAKDAGPHLPVLRWW